MVQGGVNFLGRNRIDAVGPGSDRYVTFRDRISKGIREQESKSVLDLEKTSDKSQRTSPSCSIANGAQSGP